MRNLLFALSFPLFLTGCGEEVDNAKEIERLRGEVTRLKAANQITGRQGEETNHDAPGEQVSFPPLPMKWQSKGGIAEATEDLRALHTAAQRYLNANDDVWPQAPRAIHSEFWEAELEPFGATGEHWRHFEYPMVDNQPFYVAFPIEAKKGAAYQDENQRWFGTRGDIAPSAIQVEILSYGRIQWLSQDISVQLPVSDQNQSLTRLPSNLAKINIRQDGTYVVMGQQSTEEQVLEWLKTEVEKTPDLKVLIRCDKEAKHIYMANVISICRNVGVPRANIAVKTEQ